MIKNEYCDGEQIHREKAFLVECQGSSKGHKLDSCKLRLEVEDMDIYFSLLILTNIILTLQ